MGRTKKKLPNELADALALKGDIAGDVPTPARKLNKAVMAFIAPELLLVGAPSDASGFEQKPSWDVAVRFQDLKRLGNIPAKEKARLKRRAIEGVLTRARAI